MHLQCTGAVHIKDGYVSDYVPVYGQYPSARAADTEPTNGRPIHRPAYLPRCYSLRERIFLGLPFAANAFYSYAHCGVCAGWSGIFEI